MPHPVDIHVGKRIRLRRNLVGMSQEELGKTVGVTFQQVQKYERGSNRVGSSRLFEFSKVMSVPVGFFFDGIEASQAGLAEDGTAYEHANTPAELDRETLSLIQSFQKITDPDVRQRIIALLRTLAD